MLNLRYAKNVIRNTDYGVRKLCLFPKRWWNFNAVKIISILYPLFSTKYIAFLYYWSTRFEANIKDIKAIMSFMECDRSRAISTQSIFVFSFVFRIACSQTVWVTVIFKVRNSCYKKTISFQTRFHYVLNMHHYHLSHCRSCAAKIFDAL